MSERTPAKPLGKDILETPATQALNRIADALERLADAYLYCNAPDEEGEEAYAGQSLSDTGLSGQGR